MGACSERIVGEHDFKMCEPYGSRRTRLREYPIRQPSILYINLPLGRFFYWIWVSDAARQPTGDCSERIVGEHDFNLKRLDTFHYT